MKKKIFIIALMILGFIYRIYGLTSNNSFWSDEAHEAIFVRAIIERGKPILANGYSTKAFQWLSYELGALSAKAFGLNEMAIRFPSVIFGILTIWAVYLLGKELFGESVGVVSAAITAFLKNEILWSRQARPYQALQFFNVLGAWFLYKLIKQNKFKWQYFLGFLFSGVLSSLMHGLGLFLLIIGFFYIFIFRFSWFKKWWIMALVIVSGVSVFILFRNQILLRLPKIGSYNNFYYYRVFLFHHYPLLVFLALTGFVLLLFQKDRKWVILPLLIVCQGIIVSFFLLQPFTRYFYPVFTFLILLSVFCLKKISDTQNPKVRTSLLVIMTLFVVIISRKFSLKPQPIYQLNEDMQETPEVDYKKIYKFIGDKKRLYPEISLVSCWNDHFIWYLGEGKLNYRLRVNPTGQERDPVSSAIYIDSLEKLKELIKKEKKGLILLESWESALPKGTEEYIRSNLKKEYEIDRLYPEQPRYWPVTVYSWGIK